VGIQIAEEGLKLVKSMRRALPWDRWEITLTPRGPGAWRGTRMSATLGWLALWQLAHAQMPQGESNRVLRLSERCSMPLSLPGWCPRCLEPRALSQHAAFPTLTTTTMIESRSASSVHMHQFFLEGEGRTRPPPSPLPPDESGTTGASSWKLR